MKKLFCFLRMTLLPLPLVIWTAVAPGAFLLFTFVFVAYFFGLTIFNFFKFPAVLYYSSIDDNTDYVRQYFLDLKESYPSIKDAGTIVIGIAIAVLSVYKDIFYWNRDRQFTLWVIGVNIITLVLIGCVFLSKIIFLTTGVDLSGYF